MCSAFWCPPKSGKHDYRDPAGMPQLYLVLVVQRNAMQEIKNNRLPWDGILGVWFHAYGWTRHTFCDSSYKDRISEPKGDALPTLTGSVQHPALQTMSHCRNSGLQGPVMFICATLHGILISNCADLKPLNGHTGAVVQPSFCVSTLSKKSRLRTSAGG